MAITRDDIEAKARDLIGAVDDTRQSAKDMSILVGVAIGVVVLAAFVVGRRRGSRNKTMVEVYRV